MAQKGQNLTEYACQSLEAWWRSDYHCCSIAAVSSHSSVVKWTCVLPLGSAPQALDQLAHNKIDRLTNLISFTWCILWKNGCFVATLTARKELIRGLKGQRLGKKVTYQKSVFILISHLKTNHSRSITYNGLFGHCIFSYFPLESIYGDVYNVQTWMIWDH